MLANVLSTSHSIRYLSMAAPPLLAPSTGGVHTTLIVVPVSVMIVAFAQALGFSRGVSLTGVVRRIAP